MHKPRSFAPIIASVLLLLPVLYVGSYLALVVPGGFYLASDPFFYYQHHYRADQKISGIVFWPLEQIDRKVRPRAWDESLDADMITPRIIILGDEDEPLGIDFECP